MDQPMISAEAEGKLTMCLVAGVVILLAGGVVAGLAWPHDTIDAAELTRSQHGSRIISLLGLLAVGVGQMIAFVGLVGYGVKFGMEAHQRPTPTPERPAPGAGRAANGI